MKLNLLSELTKNNNLVSEDASHFLVKINDSTITALKDIRTFRTISVLPKKNGMIAVVRGADEDIEEVKRRWPDLMNNLAEESIAQEEFKMPGIDKMLLNIAKKHIPSIETLEERGADSLDFHDVGVVGLKRALQAAFIAGMSHSADGKK